MKNSSWVVCLGAGIDAVETVRQIANMGHSVIAVDQDPCAPAFALAAYRLAASAYAPMAVLSALDLLEQKTDIRPAGVLCAGIDAPHVASVIAHSYGLVGPSYGTAYLSRHKYDQAVRLSAGGVRVPWFDRPERHRINDLKRLIYARGPLVVKPIANRGARGVVRVVDPDTLPGALELAEGHSKSGQIMVEQWIEGAQISSESLVQDGKVLWTAYAERNYSRLEEFAPHVIEDGSDMPVDWRLDDCDAMYRCESHQQLQMAVNAIGLRNGTLKGDLVWHGGLVTVIEVATRLSGGGFCSVLIPQCYGVPFVELATRIAFGEKIEAPQPRLQHYVCQRFEFPVKPTCHPERGRSVVGLGASREEARESARRELRAGTKSETA